MRLRLRCPACNQDMAASQRICPPCVNYLTRELILVPDLADDLDLTITRQTRMGASSGRGGGDTGLPWNEKASTAKAILDNTLSAWVVTLYQAIGHTTSHPGYKTGDMARWLHSQQAALIAHPDAALAFDELRAAIRQARHSIDRRASAVYAGPCGGCKEDLFAGPGEELVTCKTCDVVYSVERRREWMLTQVMDMLLTAKRISNIAPALGHKVKEGTIRTWAHRGRITAQGKDAKGHPTYRVGDVIALAKASV